MALQYIMANAKLYTPREYPPHKVYIHVTSRLYTQAQKRTRCYTPTHTHIPGTRCAGKTRGDRKREEIICTG